MSDRAIPVMTKQGGKNAIFLSSKSDQNFHFDLKVGSKGFRMPKTNAGKVSRSELADRLKTIQDLLGPPARPNGLS